MASTLVGSILDELLKSLSRAFSYETAALAVGELEAGQLRVRTSAGESDVETQELLLEAMSADHAMVFAANSDSDGARGKPRRMVVALRSPSRVFGAIVLTSDGFGEGFSPQHLEMAEAMAALAGAALEERAAFQEADDRNQALRRRVMDLEAVVEAIPIGIGMVLDPACPQISGNPALSRMLGLLPGQPISFDESDPDQPDSFRLCQEGRPMPMDTLPIQRAISEGITVSDVEMEVVRAGKTVGNLVGYAAPLPSAEEGPRGAVGAFVDVTQARAAADRTTRLAYHDPLTGLPNRLLFGDRLKQALAQAPRRGQAVAVLSVDLDGFKLINDSLGSAVGDRLLCGVAKRLMGCVRSEDTVARLGGDEFALILPSLDRAADAARVARKIIDRLRYSFECDAGQYYMTACVGISTSPEDGSEAEALIRKADIAMYQAKESGRNSYRFFKAALHRRALERLLLEKGLRTALSRNELRLHYQPIVHGAGGELHGFEALLRWDHPELGSIPPSEFVPLAEAMGALKAIEPWVLHEACRQTKEWQSLFNIPLSISVNLSPQRVSESDMPGKVASALSETKLPAASLEIEITETRAIRALDAATRNLRRVRETGVRVSVDDFGTGFTSIAYLARLPLDSLKVDRSFVRRIGRHSESAAVVRAVIGMAHDLNLTTVAEGVETREQLQMLSSWRCDRIQGFLVGAPLPPLECQRRLAALQPS